MGLNTLIGFQHYSQNLQDPRTMFLVDIVIVVDLTISITEHK